MTIYLAFPIAVLVVGLILMLAATGKAADIGRLMFHAGMTAALIIGVHGPVHVG